MTGVKPRIGGMKAAVAGLAILYAAAALAVLATASFRGSQTAPGAIFLEQGPLGR